MSQDASRPPALTTTTEYEGIRQIKRDEATIWELCDPSWQEAPLEQCPPMVAMWRLGIVAEPARLTPGQARELIREALAELGELTPRRAARLDGIPETSASFARRAPELATIEYWAPRFWPGLARP